MTPATVLRGAHRTGPSVHPDRVGVAAAMLSDGQSVVLVDHRNSLSELVASAELISAERLAFFVRHTAGFVRVAMLADDLDRLSIPPMWWSNAQRHGPSMAVAIDARDGISTGISARDRARTVRLLADPRTCPDELTRPGHVIPLAVHSGSDVDEFGIAEASVWLCSAVRLRPAAVLSVLVADTGALLDADMASAFAVAHELPALSVNDVSSARDLRIHGRPDWGPR